MVIENIPNVSDLYRILKVSREYKELDIEKQYDVIAMFQHWTDEYVFESEEKVRCKKCDFGHLLDPSIEGQLKHLLAHILDIVTLKKGVLTL